MSLFTESMDMRQLGRGEKEMLKKGKGPKGAKLAKEAKGSKNNKWLNRVQESSTERAVFSYKFSSAYIRQDMPHFQFM
jgi:hypothetical protein